MAASALGGSLHLRRRLYNSAMASRFGTTVLSSGNDSIPMNPGCVRTVSTLRSKPAYDSKLFGRSSNTGFNYVHVRKASTNSSAFFDTLNTVQQDMQEPDKDSMASLDSLTGMQSVQGTQGGELVVDSADSTVDGTVDLSLCDTTATIVDPPFQFLGLASWTPPGLYQNLIEVLHISTGFAWCGTIAVSTIIIRVCMFPLVIKSQRNAVEMQNHMPTITRLQQNLAMARGSGSEADTIKAIEELRGYTKENKISPLKTLLVPLAQMPIFISVFWGLRGMVELPVESMKTGGTLWFSDLTLTDPYYLLPLLTMGTLLATVELGIETTSKVSVITKKVMRMMPFFIFPVVANFPSALCCYWLTSNLFTLGQVLLLKVPSVRTFFKIGAIIKHPEENSSLTKKTFKEGFRDSMKNSKIINEVELRSRYDAVKFREPNSGHPAKMSPPETTTKTTVDPPVSTESKSARKL